MGISKKKSSGEPSTVAELIAVVDAVESCGGNFSAAGRILGIHRGNVARKYKQAMEKRVYQSKEKVLKTVKKNDLTLNYIGEKISTPEDLIKDAEIDLEVWEEVERSINNWEVAGKLNLGQEVKTLKRQRQGKTTSTEEHLAWKPQSLWKSPLRQIKIRFRKKSNERLAIQALLKRMESGSPVVPRFKFPKAKKQGFRRELEISIMDPHFGLQCFPPGADRAWSLDDCESIVMWAIEGLIRQAESYFPVERIIMPFGNDFMHCDNIHHETTAGTSQPESVAWHHVYERAEVLAIGMVDRLKEVAPVQIYEIPGNHDRQSAFTLARVLRAYYHQDKNVEVDASASPYKFHHFGCNLIGFEHGHSVATIRLAALMANEAPDAWAATKGGYREWHLGDQHRKGSSKPSVMEEQGVSVEFLPGLTPPNEWHRTKSYNWQKRGAMGWVWDHDHGPIARVQVNLNSFTGKPSGAKRSA